MIGVQSAARWRRWQTPVLGMAALVLVLAALLLLVTPPSTNTPTEAAPKVIYVPPVGELPAVSLPVIVADAAHHDLGRGSQPAIYDIPAGNGFVLDARGLPLRVPAIMQLGGPNRLFVTIHGTAYHLGWDPAQSVYVLSPETLVPWVEYAPPFGGLKAGQTVLIAVGYWDEGGKQTGDEQFIEMWRATGIVR